MEFYWGLTKIVVRIWLCYLCNCYYIFRRFRYDDGSDESNFEAFDDESPLLANDKNLLVAPSGIKNPGVTVTQTSELGDFDNRRFFR